MSRAGRFLTEPCRSGLPDPATGNAAAACAIVALLTPERRRMFRARNVLTVGAFRARNTTPPVTKGDAPWPAAA